jgi:hypothetical protein
MLRCGRGGCLSWRRGGGRVFCCLIGACVAVRRSGLSRGEPLSPGWRCCAVSQSIAVGGGSRGAVVVPDVGADRCAGDPQCDGGLCGDGGNCHCDDNRGGVGARECSSIAGGVARVVAVRGAAQGHRARGRRTRFRGFDAGCRSDGAVRGAWLALLAASAIAAGAFLARRLAAVDVLVLGAAQFLTGAAILAVAATIIGGSPLNGLSARFVSAVVVLALAGSALPYVLWFAELRRASITAVTSWTLLLPVVGLVLGVLVLGKSLTGGQVVGTAVVVAALTLVAKAGRAPCDRLRCWQQSGDALTECG